jgi:uncharacterized membrane protein YgcG
MATKRTLHGRDVGGLDVVFELGDFLLEFVKRDEIVLDNERDLELGNAVSDGDQLGGAPDETLLLNGAHGFLELLHVGLVVPRLDLHGDHGLGALGEVDVKTWHLSRHTFAVVFGLFAFFSLYAATRSALMRSASSSTSSSEPKRSTSSSSSSSFFTGAAGSDEAAGAALPPRKDSPAVLEPGRFANSDSKLLMW